jgi:hypothetical protein
VSIVKVIHVAVVLHGSVAAIRAVRMGMRFVNFVIGTHLILLMDCCWVGGCGVYLFALRLELYSFRYTLDACLVSTCSLFR